MKRDSDMIRLPGAAARWGTQGFAPTLKAELEALPLEALPLQQGLQSGNMVADEPVEVMFIDAHEQDGVISGRVGVFFGGLVAGCACADDPTPMDTQPEYCVLDFALTRNTGVVEVRVSPDLPHHA